MSSDPDQQRCIGWREWVTLPQLGVPALKAKIDTGARSSSLHAVDSEQFEREGKTFVRFKICPLQRRADVIIEATAEVVDFRKVRSSTGHEELRPVILTTAELMGNKWDIELTLTNRELMGFRMLLGRSAVRGQFLIDPIRSYCGGRIKKSLLRKTYRIKRDSKTQT